MANPGQTDARDYSGLEVLLIDDDEFFRKLITRQLRSLGVKRVRQAEDGAQALCSLHQPDHPDLVICDLQMPTMSGVEFLRQLWLENFTGEVFLVSGVGEQMLQAAAELARAYGLRLLDAVTKPLSTENLAQSLRRESVSLAVVSDVEGVPALTVADLEAALQAGEIVLHYQPKLAMGDGQLVGIEALLRWSRADGAEIPPGRLLALAKEHGLTRQLTNHVLNNALRPVAQLFDRRPELTLALNIFPDDLIDHNLPGSLNAQARAADISCERLILEVPGVPGDAAPERLLEVAAQLALHGAQLALDGHGVGYVEMERLMQLPFREFKLDRAFVAGASQRRHAPDILEGQVALARRLGLRVVAEGVEDRADWDFLALAGCDQAQGHFVAPAMPAEALEYWAGWYDAEKQLE